VTSPTSDPDPATRRATAETTVTTPDPASSPPQPFGTPIAFRPLFQPPLHRAAGTGVGPRVVVGR
jgi:hypothetical protein